MKYSLLLMLLCSGCNLLTNSATIRLHNNSPDEYEVTIDKKEVIKLPPNTFKDVTITAKYHELTASQLNGYLVYPSQYRLTVNAEIGKEYAFSFP